MTGPAGGFGTTPDETADHVAISRLQHAYADAVDRRDWAALHQLFRPDAVVELDLVERPGRSFQGPAELGDFIGPAIERFAFFQFVILNAHVELWPGGDRDRATARVFMCELRYQVGAAGRDDAYGLYRDEYRRVDGRWWIAGRRYRSLGRFPVSHVFPIDWSELR